MKRLAIVVTGLLFVVSVNAQSDEPPWIIAQRAERAFARGELGDALRLYGEALAGDPDLVEARVGMARTYDAQAATDLALRFYEEALNHPSGFDVPDDRYLVLEEVAAIHRRHGETARAIERYREILRDDPFFGRDRRRGDRAVIRDSVLENGVDRTIILYRIDTPQTLNAHRALAELLLEEGNSELRDEALDHAIYALLEIVGRATRALIDRDPVYRFENLAQLEESARDVAIVDVYLREIDYDGAVRLLADALRAYSDPRARGRADELPQR